MNYNDDNVTRRLFMKKLGAVCLSTAGSALVLAGCGGESGSGTQAESGTCNDTTGLTEQQVQARQALAYVDQTPYPEKRCDNCNFWITQQAGQPCGGCQVLPGPVHPKGHCNSWAAQLA